MPARARWWARARAGAPAVVLERPDAVGASWRGHYDRLRLHTMRWASARPGLSIPRREGPWVWRDGFLAYRETYARHYRLDIRPGTLGRAPREGPARSAAPHLARGVPGLGRRPRHPPVPGGADASLAGPGRLSRPASPFERLPERRRARSQGRPRRRRGQQWRRDRGGPGRRGRFPGPRLGARRSSRRPPDGGRLLPHPARVDSPAASPPSRRRRQGVGNGTAFGGRPHPLRPQGGGRPLQPDRP